MLKINHIKVCIQTAFSGRFPYLLPVNNSGREIIMKLAFSTLGCLGATADEVIHFALDNGIDGVEPRVNDKGETFAGNTVKDAGALRAMFRNAGIAVTDLAISCSISEYDEGQIAIGKNGIDFAEAIGTNGVRVFVGTHQSRFGDADKTDREGMIKALSELSDYGREKNVDILLETHSSFSSGRAMSGLVRELNRDNIRIIWDVLHSVEYGEAPLQSVGFMGDGIAHVHLKDARPGDDREATQFVHTDLGKGVISVPEVIKALDTVGYDGYYSLEWEAPWRPEIRELYPDFNNLLKAYKRFLGE